METIILFLIVFTIVILVNIISRLRFAKKRRKVNKKVDNALKEKNFNATKTIFITDCRTLKAAKDDEKQRMFLDTENRKFFLADYKKEKFFVLDFNEIVDCEIYEHSAMISEGRRREIKEWCNSMKFIIKIDSIDTPQIEYDIVFGRRRVDKESVQYKELRDGLQEVKALFDVIKAEKTSKRKHYVYCKYCGAKNHEESLKCEFCGGNLK